MAGLASEVCLGRRTVAASGCEWSRKPAPFFAAAVAPVATGAVNHGMNASLFHCALALVVAAGVAGCTATRARTVEIDSPPHSRVALTSSAWTLTALNGEPVSVPAGAAAPSIHFDPATLRVSGNAGVNRFSGQYSLQGASLTFGPLVATKMAGPEELNRLEIRFLQALEGTNRWRTEGDSLEFLAGERVVAHFAKLPGR